MAVIPHLAVPLRLDGSGRFATNEQDSADDIASCVAVILATPEGSRAEVPDFGSPRSEFAGVDVAGLIDAVQEWEPRADLDADVRTGLGPGDTLVHVIAQVTPHV